MKSDHSNGYAEALDAAYRATAYVVAYPEGSAILRADQHCPELEVLLQNLQQRDWAFISASNPGSQPLPQNENDIRHKRLISVVEAKGWSWLPGEGVPDAGDWVPETSLLVLGIPLQEALQIACEFGQNAILAGSRGGLAQLHYVRGNPSG